MSGQIIDDYRIIPTRQLVRAIKEVNNRSERFCFILGSGASVSSGIPAGGELERRWMEELERDPGLEEIRPVADKLKSGNHLEYDFQEIAEAWERCKHTGSPLSSEYYFDIYKLRFFPNHRNALTVWWKMRCSCTQTRNPLSSITNFLRNINKMPGEDRKDTPSEDEFREEIEKMAARGNDSQAQREKANQMTAWDYRRQGMRHYDLSEYKEAYECFSSAISKQPDNAVFYNDRGYACVNLHEYEKALSDFNKALSLNPNFSQVFIGRGFAYLSLGRYEDALSDYTKAISLKPDEAVFYNNRGALYNDMEKYDLALSDLDKAIALKPDFANPYRHAGIAWEKKGNFEKALRSYTKAIQLDSKYKEAYADRARIYLALGDSKNASKDEETASKLTGINLYGIS